MVIDFNCYGRCSRVDAKFLLARGGAGKSFRRGDSAFVNFAGRLPLSAMGFALFGKGGGRVQREVAGYRAPETQFSRETTIGGGH